jgi:hypothetical protein
MKVSKTVILATLVSLTSISAHAIDKAGNGGGAFVCQDPSESEFLDLYEAREAGYKIIPSTDSVDDQIKAALSKLAAARFKKIFDLYEQVRAANIIPPPKGQELAWPSDALNTYAKESCPGKGIMLYHDSVNKHLPDTIEQDTPTLNSLPATQQAAAWVHETVYKYMRKHYGNTDSVKSQIWTGFAFSNETEDQALAAVVAVAGNSPIGACWSGNVCSNFSKSSCEAYSANNVWTAGFCPN